jgi:hypothetical protein
MIKMSFSKQNSFSDVEVSTQGAEAESVEISLYDKIKEVVRQLPLFLVSDSLKVGVENYIVTDAEKAAFPVLTKGYKVTTSFNGYEPEYGNVDTTIEAIYLDEEGKEYREEDCLIVAKTYEEAEKKRAELLSGSNG